MLVLSRREGESIMIGDDIEVRVTRIDNDAVKIGVIAPRSLRVFRNEVYEKIRESNLSAARTNASALPVIQLGAKKP